MANPYRALRTVLLIVVSCFLLVPDGTAQIFDGWTKQPKPAAIYTRYKLGFGLPFGQLGFNAELGTGVFAGTLGVGVVSGTDINSTFGASLGIRTYVMKEEKSVRPRLSAHYGVNGVFKENNRQRTAWGLAFGIGFEHRLTDRIVYDMDLSIPLNGTNTARPVNKELESKAIPSLGIGIYLSSPDLR